MANMYGTSGVVFPECGHEHPEWTEYPHPGHPPVSYYMTAYDIAVKNGYTGTEEDWLASLKGETGMTAFELYVKNTGYTGTEAEWNTMVNAAKTEAVAAKNDAVAAKVAAVAAKDAVDEMMGDLPEGYDDVCGKVRSLGRKLASVNAGLGKRLVKDGLYYSYQYGTYDDVPSFGDYKDECHIGFRDEYRPMKNIENNENYYGPPPVGGLLEMKRGASSSKYWGMQYYFPYNSAEHGWQIWARQRMYNSAGSAYWGSWFCVNGIEKSKCHWRDDSYIPPNYTEDTPDTVSEGGDT